MSDADRLDAYAARAYTGEHRTLTCIHADRRRGERLCEACRVTADVIGGEDPRPQRVIEQVYAGALRQTIARLHPQLQINGVAWLDQESGRFFHDRRRNVCVHNQRLHEACAECDAMAYKINRGSSQ